MSISLQPEYWGEGLWKIMFSIAYVYPAAPTEADRVTATNFYNTLTRLIPCEKCRIHYTAILKEKPVEAAVVSRTELLKWLEGVSNNVNDRLEKSRIDFERLYSDMDTHKVIVEQPRALPVPKIIRVQPTKHVAKPPSRPSMVVRRRGEQKAPRKKIPCNCGKKST